MQHKDLNSTRWETFTLCEQLANVGSEVIRALRWREKGNTDLSTRAFYRALELIDYTLMVQRVPSRRREIARVRSALVDDFVGMNIYASTDALWKRYFVAYTYAANSKRT